MLDGAFHADVAGGSGGRARDRAQLERRAGGDRRQAAGTRARRQAEGAAAEARRDAERRSDCSAAREIAPLLTLDTDSPASVVSCVYRARERARTLRDVISTEMWEALNSFYLSLGRYDLEAALATGPYSVYQEVKERCALFWGLLTRRCCATRRARSWRPAAASRRPTWCCGCCGSRSRTGDLPDDALRRAAAADARGRGAGAAAGGRRLPGVPASPAPAPDARRASAASCCTRAPTRARCAPSLAAAAARARDRRPGAALLAAGAAARPADRRPRAAAAHARSAPDRWSSCSARVQDELELIDHDIDERYFAIAALAMVHV